jgi:hypothetical protein
VSSLTLRGILEVGGGCAVSSCASGDRSAKVLSLRCASSQYQGVVETAEPIRIQTAGAPGAAFVDLALLQTFTSIEFLYLRADAPIVLRIGAAAPSISGSLGIFPTGFVGGETLTLDSNGTTVPVAFGAGDQSAVQVAAQINAAFALLGLPTPRASVSTSGQIAIEGLGTGSSSTLSAIGGTGAAQIGFGTFPSAIGAGADVPTWGTFLAEFGVSGSAPLPPARIQLSGSANVTVVAAGRTV